MHASIVKSATHEPGRRRLRREAELLRRARHPGVVAVAEFVDDDGLTRLTLTPVDGTTLAEAPPTDALAALRFAAALARTVADLHEIRIAHRHLRPDHVLVTGDSRPMLCGFADATDEPTDDDRRIDACSLRDLVELLAVHVIPATSPRAAVALRSLAADLRSLDEPWSAAELATRAGRAATLASRTTRPRSRLRRPDRPAPRSMRRVGAFALAPMIVLAVVIGLTRHVGEPAGGVPAASTATDAAPGRAPEQVGARPAVRFTAGGAEYEVGVLGDQIVVADWACTGEPSAVLLRPSTGEVFVFATLPAAAETMTGRRLATVPDATELITTATDGACPEVAVKNRAGTTHVIGNR